MSYEKGMMDGWHGDEDEIDALQREWDKCISDELENNWGDCEDTECY